MGKVEMLNQRDVCQQCISSFDWNRDKLGLSVLCGLDQTVRVMIVTKLNLYWVRIFYRWDFRDWWNSNLVHFDNIFIFIQWKQQFWLYCSWLSVSQEHLLMILLPDTTRSTQPLKKEPIDRESTTEIWLQSQQTMPNKQVISKERTSIVISHRIS